MGGGEGRWGTGPGRAGPATIGRKRKAGERCAGGGGGPAVLGGAMNDRKPIELEQGWAYMEVGGLAPANGPGPARGCADGGTGAEGWLWRRRKASKS